jgi:hypothetical protein
MGKDDAIYQDNGVVKIRATAIQSGALQVGGTTGEPDSDNVKFYADVTGGPVRIAGWTVDSNKIITGTLGQENSFHMYSSGFGTGKHFGADSSKDWALGIGGNFGVTNKGEMHASAGKIAGWTISSNKISKGTLGSDSSFYIYSSDFGQGAYFGAGSSKSWALGIGSHFGVTNTGEVYATAGQIAGWTFDSNKISKGTLSQANSFYMYSSNFGTGQYFGADSSKSWALGIG